VTSFLPDLCLIDGTLQGVDLHKLDMDDHIDDLHNQRAIPEEGSTENVERAK
jgi:hypothetical protein